jgi:hypothetical protein
LTSNGGRLRNNNGCVTGFKPISTTSACLLASTYEFRYGRFQLRVSGIARRRTEEEGEQRRSFLCERRRRRISRAMREQLQKSVRGYSVGRKPGLRVDRLVHVAVLDTGGVELEVQVSSECAAGLANASDDVPGSHCLAGAY